MVGVLLVRRGFLNVDQIPVGVEFVGEHLGERRMNTLAHFRVRNDGGGAVVGTDLHPQVEQRLVGVGDDIA